MCVAGVLTNLLLAEEEEVLGEVTMPSMLNAVEAELGGDSAMFS